jgi:hypothetical protein
LFLTGQAEQGGRIGLTLLGWWYEPGTQTPDDVEAAARMNDFHIGWLDWIHTLELKSHANNYIV